MHKLINALMRDERGVSALEYVILAVVVVAAVVAGGFVLKSTISSAFSATGSKINQCVTGTMNADGTCS
jgi:pilus assembly protein Flp/PilA